MSKADDMFKELGYEKEVRDTIIIYRRTKCKQYFRRKNVIYFDHKRKAIKVGDMLGQNMSRIFNMQELKAITEKVKELGWLDE